MPPKKWNNRSLLLMPTLQPSLRKSNGRPACRTEYASTGTLRADIPALDERGQNHLSVVILFGSLRHSRLLGP